MGESYHSAKQHMSKILNGSMFWTGLSSENKQTNFYNVNLFTQTFPVLQCFLRLFSHICYIVLKNTKKKMEQFRTIRKKDSVLI